HCMSLLLNCAAMQQVLENLGDLPNSTGAKHIDLIFLKGIMESPIAHERLEDVKLEAVQENNLELMTEILGDIRLLTLRDNSARELSQILQGPHFQSLLETHDRVASKCYETPPLIDIGNEVAMNNALMQADAVRMIGIRKKAGEPLGVTFRIEQDDLVIARILHGGMIDRQGLLHVGDVIKEVNGRRVGSDPVELQEALSACSGGVMLKILPSYRETPHPPEIYVRPHFDYNPANDTLNPCREAGLAFSQGDILQIVNREDTNWWQACLVVGGDTGLIPSQFLEEKRKAFGLHSVFLSGVLCGTVTGKKKKKMMYLTARNAEFDRHELQIYEEVARMPPFQRKTLVLIGAQGVGRRSLKNRLVVLHPTSYGNTVPFTSRGPRPGERDGQTYHFVTRLDMELDIRAGHYLEHGEYDGNLYGTKIDSIHEVLITGRTCILDVNPQVTSASLGQFEHSGYDHCLIFVDLKIMICMNVLKFIIENSARIQRTYRHYFDFTIVNDNLDTAFETLQATLEKLSLEPQWVPVSWVY
uniref:Membrane palmitoylated protein 2 n=1 Tax=Electrophorus electricus TaxID=8005 RepID=A0A4W4EZT4_ELEEL